MIHVNYKSWVQHTHECHNQLNVCSIFGSIV